METFYPVVELPQQASINATLVKSTIDGIIQSWPLNKIFQKTKSLLENFEGKVPENLTLHTFNENSLFDNYLAVIVNATPQTWAEECRTAFQHWGIIGSALPYLEEYSAAEIQSSLEQLGQDLYPVNAFVSGTAIFNPLDGKVLGRTATQPSHLATDPALPLIDMKKKMFTVANQSTEAISSLCFVEKPIFFGHQEKYLEKITEAFEATQRVISVVREWSSSLFSAPSFHNSIYFSSPILAFPSAKLSNFLENLESIPESIIDLGEGDVMSWLRLGASAGDLETEIGRAGNCIRVGLQSNLAIPAPFFWDTAEVCPLQNFGNDIYQSTVIVTLEELFVVNVITSALTSDGKEIRARFLIQPLGQSMRPPTIRDAPLTCMQQISERQERTACNMQFDLGETKKYHQANEARCAEAIIQGQEAASLQAKCSFKEAEPGLHLERCSGDAAYVTPISSAIDIDCDGHSKKIIVDPPLVNLSSYRKCSVYREGTLIYGTGSSVSPSQTEEVDGNDDFLSALEKLARYTQFNLGFSILSTACFLVVFIVGLLRLKKFCEPALRDFRAGRTLRRREFCRPTDAAEAPVRETMQLQVSRPTPRIRQPMTGEQEAAAIELYRINRYPDRNSPGVRPSPRTRPMAQLPTPQMV